MAKECFYLGAEGDEPDKVMKGLSWLLENSRPTGGWFAVLGLDNLETISNYDPRLIILKGLAKDKRHKTVINGRVIYLITEREIPYDGENRALLAIHPTKQYLDKLHSIRNIPKILAIEWGENEIEDWKNYRRAVRYGSSVVKQQETLALNKVVMVALEEMVPAINIANHMSHPRNRDIVVHTFKILVKSGERFYSRDVKSWLVSHGGWNPIDAQEAADIAENIQSGKRRYMTSYLSNYWYPNAIDKWRQKAEKRA